MSSLKTIRQSNCTGHLGLHFKTSTQDCFKHSQHFTDKEVTIQLMHI